MTREEAIHVMEKYTDTESGISKVVAEAHSMAIRALEQCEPCENCISRQTVFEQINCWIGSGEYRYTNATYYLTRRIKELSSINPIEPKTGHWMYSKAVNTGEIVWSECSECREGQRGCAKRMKYCPMCGCRMESEG